MGSGEHDTCRKKCQYETEVWYWKYFKIGKFWMK
jgi:hypothetical protein